MEPSKQAQHNEDEERASDIGRNHQHAERADGLEAVTTHSESHGAEGTNGGRSIRNPNAARRTCENASMPSTTNWPAAPTRVMAKPMTKPPGRALTRTERRATVLLVYPVDRDQEDRSPTSSARSDLRQVLVFTRTKLTASRLASWLDRGLEAVGDPQRSLPAGTNSRPSRRSSPVRSGSSWRPMSRPAASTSRICRTS